MSWARNIVPACQELADLLTAAGVPATLDRAKLNLPGAWVTPGKGRQLTLAGAGRLSASVLLVTNAESDLEQLEALADLLDQALTVVTPDEDVDTSVVLPIRGNPLPAFRLVVNLKLEKE